MNPTNTNTQYDTAPGVGGRINTNTGQTIDSSGAATGMAGTNTASGYVAPPITQTQDASKLNSQLSGSSTGSLQFPNPPADQTNNNSSTLASIQPTDLNTLLNQSQAPTALDNNQTQTQGAIAGLLSRIKNMGGGADSSGKIDTSGALPGALDAAAQKLGYKDNATLNNQMTDINNQIQALQKEAQTIPLQDQQDATGRGITQQGLAPIEAGKIRENTIQALKLSSIAQTLQGNIAAAQKMADTAINAQFKPLELQLQYDQQLYNMNKDALQRQDSKKAVALQAQLTERTRQLSLQQDNAKVGAAMANSIMAGNKGNPGAQLAAQNAMKLDPLDPQYLQKLSQTLGGYATLDDKVKLANIAQSRAAAANSATSHQDSLEQQYRTALEKAFSARSGSLGLQMNKVDAAIHARTLLNQYKQPDGTYNVPPAQYAELGLSLANLISGTTAASEGTREAITQKSAAGDLAGMLTYVTGTNYSGSTQDIIKNLADSIDRQGQTSEKLRDQYMTGLKGLKPTSLSADRADSITQDYLPKYSDAINGGYGGDTQTVNLKDPATGKVKSFTLSPQDLQDALTQGFIKQ